jgi:glycyl-tRNA synthetase
MENKENLMEKIVSLSKQRGFVFPGSELYGGLANSWDFGPLGTELKNNIKKHWWKTFVQKRDDMIGLDAAIIMNPKTWEASGHLKEFKDPLVECKKCHKRFRADDENVKKNCPECKGELTEQQMFSGLLKTFLGPVDDQSSEVYLRPETAQAIFVDFPTLAQTGRKKIPFGVAQIGKSFRNEITPGNFIFRTREFEQMEIEYFFNPKEDWSKYFEMWLEEIKKWMEEVGIDKNKLLFHEIPDGERAFYSKRTIDVEFDFPFGMKELLGIAYRTDFDLSAHEKASGKDLKYFDAEKGEKYIPHVIEPSWGLERMMLAILLSAYTEEEAPATDGKTEKRIVLKLSKEIAPIKIAILPLSKKPELEEVSKNIYKTLQENYMCEYDVTQSIGKRYRRQDEIGTPYCVTIDFETLNDEAVTVRDRDTMKQERIKISELQNYFSKSL